MAINLPFIKELFLRNPNITPEALWCKLCEEYCNDESFQEEESEYFDHYLFIKQFLTQRDLNQGLEEKGEPRRYPSFLITINNYLKTIRLKSETDFAELLRYYFTCFPAHIDCLDQKFQRQISSQLQLIPLAQTSMKEILDDVNFKYFYTGFHTLVDFELWCQIVSPEILNPFIDKLITIIIDSAAMQSHIPDWNARAACHILSRMGDNIQNDKADRVVPHLLTHINRRAHDLEEIYEAMVALYPHLSPGVTRNATTELISCYHQKTFGSTSMVLNTKVQVMNMLFANGYTQEPFAYAILTNYILNSQSENPSAASNLISSINKTHALQHLINIISEGIHTRLFSKLDAIDQCILPENQALFIPVLTRNFLRCINSDFLWGVSFQKLNRMAYRFSDEAKDEIMTALMNRFDNDRPELPIFGICCEIYDFITARKKLELIPILINKILEQNHRGAGMLLNQLHADVAIHDKHLIYSKLFYDLNVNRNEALQETALLLRIMPNLIPATECQYLINCLSALLAIDHVSITSKRCLVACIAALIPLDKNGVDITLLFQNLMSALRVDTDDQENNSQLKFWIYTLFADRPDIIPDGGQEGVSDALKSDINNKYLIDQCDLLISKLRPDSLSEEPMKLLMGDFRTSPHTSLDAYLQDICKINNSTLKMRTIEAMLNHIMSAATQHPKWLWWKSQDYNQLDQSVHIIVNMFGMLHPTEQRYFLFGIFPKFLEEARKFWQDNKMSRLVRLGIWGANYCFEKSAMTKSINEYKKTRQTYSYHNGSRYFRLVDVMLQTGKRYHIQQELEKNDLPQGVRQIISGYL